MIFATLQTGAEWLHCVRIHLTLVHIGASPDYLSFLANTLLRKMSLALPQAVVHHRAWLAFTHSLRTTHSAQLVEWERQVTEWEIDHGKPCPYTLPYESES